MAIISCGECSHQVSDRAASCPGCGAPVANPVKTRPRRKRVSRILITLMALWTLGTLMWLLIPSSASDQLTMRAKGTLQRFDRGVEHLWSTDRTRATQRTEGGPHQATTEQRSASAFPISNPPAPPSRAVYRTTAEQLYRDYEANVVATQTKIGGSRVRLSGKVAEIDQDATGRPVVKLWTGKDTTGAMTLAEDQRAAAAQLVRGEAIEVECDKLGRSGSLLEGSGCALGLVDSRPKEVNLALFLANDNGATRVYVVGPMSEALCSERSAEISSKLQGNRRREHVVSKNCTDAVRERIPPEGCRLDASSATIAGVPTAHLWRYDCGSSTVARTGRHRRSPSSAPISETTLASITPPASMEPGGANDDGGDSAKPIPLSVADVVAVPAAPATVPAHTTIAPEAVKGSPAPVAAEHSMTSNIRLASASSSDTGTAAVARIPTEESTVAHAAQTQTTGLVNPQGGSPSTATATTATPSDDLARVRATDPQAAEHIASYCAQTTAPTNRDTFIADCRRNEAEAWTRLVLQNEFPTLNDATRRRCNEPPFPDTYVAKETCARYLLHVQ